MKRTRQLSVLRVILALLVLTLAAVPVAVLAQDETPTATPVLSAVGRVELIDQQHVVLETSGIVEDVAVEVGDEVKIGDLLMALETALLEAAVEKAEIGLETAQIGLQELTDEPEESDVAVAEANLLQAQETLELVSDGPTDEELQAAENSVEAAWARYEKLKAGPTSAQINQAKASFAQAEIDLQEAQREYDKIAWKPESAATSTADNLQRATVAYEAAKAAFDEASKPTEAADLLGALASAYSSEDALNTLMEKPTPAALADAQAGVAAAENALDKLTRGPEDADVRKAELDVRQALLSLEEAERNLKNANVLSPIAGTVLNLSYEEGQQGGSGSPVATLADTSALKLVVNVEQTDVTQVEPGQVVSIVLYALPSRVFNGVVERIAPVSGTETGSVTFPVTILFTDETLDDVRPGMTASAGFMAGETADEPESESESEAESESESEAETETESETSSD